MHGNDLDSNALILIIKNTRASNTECAIFFECVLLLKIVFLYKLRIPLNL